MRLDVLEVLTPDGALDGTLGLPRNLRLSFSRRDLLLVWTRRERFKDLHGRPDQLTCRHALPA